MRKGAVVLVTGCAEGGIGSWYTRMFQSKGCKVYATDVQPVRSMEALSRLQGVSVLQMDVTSDASVKQVVEKVIAEEGRIDVLVNNAGLSTIGPLAELAEARLRQAYEVNVFGTLRTIRHVVPHMAAARSGRIVNVGSVVGYVATPWAGAYCSSKSCIHALTDVLRLELAPLGIGVLLVVPGSVRSNLGGRSVDLLKDDQPQWELYRGFSSAIAERATSSQSGKATSTDEFARRVVDVALSRSPPRHFVYGYMTGLFTVLRWCPLWARDAFMRWRFGFNLPSSPSGSASAASSQKIKSG